MTVILQQQPPLQHAAVKSTCCTLCGTQPWLRRTSAAHLMAAQPLTLPHFGEIHAQMALQLPSLVDTGLRLIVERPLLHQVTVVTPGHAAWIVNPMVTHHKTDTY